MSISQQVVIENLMLDANIGAYDSEKNRKQRVLFNLIIDVTATDPSTDEMDDVLCYHKITQGIEAILDEGHIVLVEKLANRVADLVLAHPLAIAIEVKVTKPDAIAHAEQVGVILRKAK